jgi:hypothetical protein
MLPSTIHRAIRLDPKISDVVVLRPTSGHHDSSRPVAFNAVLVVSSLKGLLKKTCAVAALRAAVVEALWSAGVHWVALSKTFVIVHPGRNLGNVVGLAAPDAAVFMGRRQSLKRPLVIDMSVHG